MYPWHIARGGADGRCHMAERMAVSDMSDVHECHYSPEAMKGYQLGMA